MIKLPQPEATPRAFSAVWFTVSGLGSLGFRGLESLGLREVRGFGGVEAEVLKG